MNRAGGVGLGLRRELKRSILDNAGQLDFVEIIGDRCFTSAGLREAREVMAVLPAVCHFLGLSLGSAEPLDRAYVAKVMDVIAALDPPWFSDHLAITRTGGAEIGHLAPVVFDMATVATVANKIGDLQQRSGRRFALENPAYYFVLPGATLREVDVLTQIVERADCGILLDLGNLHVNAHNHRYDPYAFLDALPLERVLQVHIAGSARRDRMLLDTHGDPVPGEVFSYLAHVSRRRPEAAVLLERDQRFPDFDELLSELRRAATVVGGAHA